MKQNIQNLIELTRAIALKNKDEQEVTNPLDRRYFDEYYRRYVAKCDIALADYKQLGRAAYEHELNTEIDELIERRAKILENSDINSVLERAKLNAEIAFLSEYKYMIENQRK